MREGVGIKIETTIKIHTQIKITFSTNHCVVIQIKIEIILSYVIKNASNNLEYYLG